MSVTCSYCDETRISRCAFINCPVEADERDATISHLQAELDRYRDAVRIATLKALEGREP